MPKAKGRKQGPRSSKSSSVSPKKGIQKCRISGKTSNSGNRQSKRLQQLKITESWPGNVHEKKNWQSHGVTEVKKSVVVNVPIITLEATPPRPSVAKPNSDISSPQSANFRLSRLHSLSKIEKLEILKNFDLQGLYGPCRGMPRLTRYNRALQFKILPAPEDIIQDILETHQNDPEFEKCIWDCNELLKVKVVGSPVKKKS